MKEENLNKNVLLRSTLSQYLQNHFLTYILIIEKSELSHNIFTLSWQKGELKKKFLGFKKNQSQTYFFESDPNCIYHGVALIVGPDGSPYAGGVFFLDIEFPQGYPYLPPRIKFKTKIYHPYISVDGHIYLDILAQSWTPAYTIQKTMLSISAFISNPSIEDNNDLELCVESDPHMKQVRDIYFTDRSKYQSIAKFWTQKYAYEKH